MSWRESSTARSRTARSIDREGQIPGAKNENIDRQASVFSAGEHKKRASLTVLVFIASPGSFDSHRGPRIRPRSYSFFFFFLFFLRFTFGSLAQDHSLLVPPSSTVFAESSRSIINDIRVTQAREILNTVALLRRLRWEREA